MVYWYSHYSLLLIVFLICLSRRVLDDHNALGAAILVVVTIWMVIGDIDVGHMLPLFLIFCVMDTGRQQRLSRPARGSHARSWPKPSTAGSTPITHS